MEILVGETVPLILKVYDGNEGLKVKAIIRNEFGDQLSIQELMSDGGGRYSSTHYKMPDCKYLTAEYTTSDPERYSDAMDLFKAIPKPEPEEKYLVGQVTDVVKLDDEILIGKVI